MRKIVLISLFLLILCSTVKTANNNKGCTTRSQSVSLKKTDRKLNHHYKMLPALLSKCDQCNDLFASENERDRHTLKEGHINLTLGRQKRTKKITERALQSLESKAKKSLSPFVSRSKNATVTSPTDSGIASAFSPITIDDIDDWGDRNDLLNDYMIIETGQEVTSPSVDQLSAMQFEPIEAPQFPAYDHKMHQEIADLLKEDGDDDNTDQDASGFLKYLEYDIEEVEKEL